MTREEAIKGLTSLVEVRRKYGDMQTMKDEIECLDMSIQALSALNEIKNIVDSAEMIIEEQYGVVIVEGYADVFDLIKKKVRLLEK